MEKKSDNQEKIKEFLLEKKVQSLRGIAEHVTVGNRMAQLYLKKLNCMTENGLSLLTCGRLWLLAIPRSDRRCATGFDFIDEPRSACRVSWSG